MKEGWEYKKLGDTLQKVKYTKKIQSSDYLQKGLVPIVSQEEETISGYWNIFDDAFIVDSPVVIFGDHNRVLKYIDFNFVLGADGVKILKPIKNLNARFLFHFLKWYNVPSLGYSRHYKLLKEIILPIPPLSEQQHIVEELDLLSSIIEKKKAQLKELDNLAQSIFYEMFGDPITNEKGWDKEKMNNLCTITSSKRIFANEYCEEGVPFYRGKEITELSKDQPLSTELNISQKRFDELKKEFGVPSSGDILITAVGTIGNIWVVSDDREFYFKDGNIIWLKDIKGFNPVFFRKLLSILIDAFKSEMAQGCAYNALTIVNLKRMKALCPPLPLQELFASKIQFIEHQKALIKQSITEVETLFNSRMDYYFN